MKVKPKTEKELLEDIKNLLILQLAKFGTKSEEIAKALSCGASTIRKKFNFKREKKNG